MSMATFEKDCCVREYHIYQQLWDSAIGENLICRREPTNESDRYAVAVTKDGTVIGHLPRKVILCYLLYEPRFFSPDDRK